jgi:hypothetical protein
MGTKRTRYILQRGKLFAFLHYLESRIDLQTGIQKVTQLFGKTNDLRPGKTKFGGYSALGHRLFATVYAVFFVDLDRLKPIDIEFFEDVRPALSRHFPANSFPASVYCLENECRHC